MKKAVTLHRFDSLDAMKAASYRYWQQQPAYARLAAVTELNAEIEALKGTRSDAPRLQRTIRLLER